MMEYSIYSVISPEGCASILLKDSSQDDKMAESLQLTSTSALKLGVIDNIIKEPLGGAHRDIVETSKRIKLVIEKDLEELSLVSPDVLQLQRTKKFHDIGKGAREIVC